MCLVGCAGKGDIMPKVGKTDYPYTKKGKAAAAAAKRKKKAAKRKK